MNDQVYQMVFPDHASVQVIPKEDDGQFKHYEVNLYQRDVCVASRSEQVTLSEVDANTKETLARNMQRFFETELKEGTMLFAPKEDRTYMLNPSPDPVTTAKYLVWEHFYSKAPNYLESEDVYVVWFAYTLGNWKALVSTNAKDDMYYEVTCNNLTGRIYVDAYKKDTQIAIERKKGGWVRVDTELAQSFSNTDN